MSIDCRQFQLLLKNGSDNDVEVMAAHLDVCPDCSARLEQASLVHRDTFPQPRWQMPPAFSSQLMPAIAEPSPSFLNGMWQILSISNSWWKPAFAFSLLVCAILGSQAYFSPNTPTPEGVPKNWSFLSAAEPGTADSFLSPDVLPDPEITLPETHETPFIPQEDWSFLDPGGSFTFIDDEEETS